MWTSDLIATGRQLHVGSMVTSSNSELVTHRCNQMVKAFKELGEIYANLFLSFSLLLNGVQDSPHVLVYFKSL